MQSAPLPRVWRAHQDLPIDYFLEQLCNVQHLSLPQTCGTMLPERGQEILSGDLKLGLPNLSKVHTNCPRPRRMALKNFGIWVQTCQHGIDTVKELTERCMNHSDTSSIDVSIVHHVSH